MRSRPTRSARSFRTRYIIAALVPALLLSLSVTGFVWAKKQVTLVVDGKTSQLRTQATTVEGFLRQADVRLGKGDVCSPRPETEITGGMTVVVRHAVPVVVRRGDEVTKLDVVGRTVADALLAAGCNLDADEEVTPSLDTRLAAGMVITAPGRFTRVKSVDVVVPFKTETYTDESLPQGVRQVLVRGSNGLKVQVLKSTVDGGVESGSSISAEKVVSKPRAQLELVGPGTVASGGPAAGVVQVKNARWSADGRTAKRMRLVSTAYSPNEPGGGGGPSTALGHPAVFGVAAVDPDVIPLGSRLYVVGYGFAMAYDTGGDIKGDRIDLCFDTGGECDRWGVRPVTVIVLN